MNPELEGFRDAVRRFVASEIVPHLQRWREQQHVDREVWRKAGEMGQALIEMQNTRFVLAEIKTEATVARIFIDRCVENLIAGRMDAVQASMAKYWISDLQCKVVDQCVQLFGGYGYMLEYPIAQMYVDARVQRIYGGANEIMKEIIARSL
jgi:acyl-CoA dehydrogenase